MSRAASRSLVRLLGPHPRQRSSIATAISNGNLDQISRVWAPATATTTMACRLLLRLLLIKIFWYLVGDLVIRGEVRHCYYQRTEKDWTDRSLRVCVNHQQQPRSGCTSRLRLKSLSWMGPCNTLLSFLTTVILSGQRLIFRLSIHVVATRHIDYLFQVCEIYQRVCYVHQLSQFNLYL